jgi:hypothetical protein
MANIHNLGGTPPPAMNVKSSDLKDVNCEKCGMDLFLPSMKFKKVSRLLTGTPNDQIVPIEVFVCANCGTILKELLPKGLKEEDSESEE